MSLRAQTPPVLSHAGVPSVRLADVEAAYAPYVPPAGDVAAPAGPVPGLVEVPVYGRNAGNASGLVFTVDYDQIFLNFENFRRVSDGWQRQQISEENLSTGGRVRITFRRYADRIPVDEHEEFLIGYVQFALNDVAPSERSSSPRVLEVRLSEAAEVGSYYYRVGPSGNQIRLDTQLTDGRIALFFKDAVTLGSGMISPVAQDLELPLYLTLLKPTDAPVVLTVDYDQIFLRFREAQPVVPAFFRGDGITENVEVAAGGESPAAVGLTLTLNPEAIDGPLLRKHVANLRFSYTGEDPTGGNLHITVQLISSDGPAEPQDKGGKDRRVAQIQVRSPYFVRGNVSSDFDVLRDGRRIYSNVGLTDVQLIFQYLMDGGSLPCRAAADVDADGRILVTDAVMLLNYLYGSGPLPSAPFPEAGWLEDYDVELGCEKSLPFYQALAQQ